MDNLLKKYILILLPFIYSDSRDAVRVLLLLLERVRSNQALPTSSFAASNISDFDQSSSMAESSLLDRCRQLLWSYSRQVF